MKRDILKDFVKFLNQSDKELELRTCILLKINDLKDY